MKARTPIFFLTAAFALASPFLGAQVQTRDTPLVLAVSILPQQYFVRRIAGDRARPLVLVGPGQSPHSYEPTPRQLADLGKSAAWLRIGVEFENALLPKVTRIYPDLPIIDTTEGIVFRRLESHSHEEEEHDGDHGAEFDEPGTPDPHVWLGRNTSKIQAARIRDVLTELDPRGSAVYARNHESLVRDIDEVFDALTRDLAPLRGKPVFVYHPAFGYFLDEFGIRQVAVETGGKEPTQRSLAALIEEAREHGGKVVFVQPQFSKNAAAVVAKAIGGTVAEINSLDAEWLENLKRMGQTLKSAIR